MVGPTLITWFGFKFNPYPTPNPTDHPDFPIIGLFNSSFTKFKFSILVNVKLGYGEVIFKLFPSVVFIIPAVKLIPWLKLNSDESRLNEESLTLNLNDPSKLLQLYLSHSLLSNIESVVVSASFVIIDVALIIESLTSRSALITELISSTSLFMLKTLLYFLRRFALDLFKSETSNS